MRKSWLYMLGLVSVLCFVAWAVAFSSTPASVHAASVTNGPSVERPTGDRAISSQQGVSGSGPSFTAADAAQFATTHRMWHNLSNTPAHVIQVQFLTSQQLSQLLGGESTGLPDNTLVCYVELQGTFTFQTPSGATVTYSKGVEVFDAHTGNLLIAGGSR
jgi:hypothetical protein